MFLRTPNKTGSWIRKNSEMGLNSCESSYEERVDYLESVLVVVVGIVALPPGNAFASAADSANDSKIFMMGLSAVLTMIRRYDAESFW